MRAGRFYSFGVLVRLRNSSSSLTLIPRAKPRLVMTLFRWTEVQLPLLKQGAPTENLRFQRAFICAFIAPSLRLLNGGWRGLLNLVNVHHFAHERGLGCQFAADAGASLKFAECSAPGENVYFDAQLIARNDGAAEARVINGDEIEKFFFAVFYFLQQKQASGLRHGFDDENAGHDGFTGKMSLKEIFVDGDVLDSDDVLPAFHFFDGVDEKKRIAVRED